MSHLLFSINTKEFGSDDMLQLAVGYGGSWHHLSMHKAKAGYVADHELPDDMRSFEVAVEMNAGPYARVQVFVTVPSGSRLGPVVERFVNADEAYTAVKSRGVVNL